MSGVTNNDLGNRRSIIRATKQQQETLKAAYYQYGEPFSEDILNMLREQTSLPTMWIRQWSNRLKKKIRAQERAIPLSSQPLAVVHCFKTESEDPALGSDAALSKTAIVKKKKKRTAPTKPRVIISKQPMIPPRTIPASAHYRNVPVSSRQLSYQPALPNSRLNARNSSLWSPPTGFSSAYFNTTNLTARSVQQAPLKYIKVLKANKDSSSALDRLLNPELAENDPFQAAMGLVFLAQRGLKW